MRGEGKMTRIAVKFKSQIKIWFLEDRRKNYIA